MSWKTLLLWKAPRLIDLSNQELDQNPEPWYSSKGSLTGWLVHPQLAQANRAKEVDIEQLWAP